MSLRFGYKNNTH